MNERIRKLAEQAGIIPGIMGLNRFTHFDPEKFAELIVWECISMANDFECDVNQRGLVDRMKQHFGVKE